MTQGILARRYMNLPLAPNAILPPSCADGSNECLIGSNAPSFHRINLCSPGCEDTQVIDPSSCDSNGMVYGNIWCWPAHVGGQYTGIADGGNRNNTTTASVANFQGRYYGWMGGHIWQFNYIAESALSVGVTPTGSPSGDPGGFTTIGDWTVSASPGSIETSGTARSRHIGLYPMVLSGVPFLCSAVHSSANTWRSIRLNGQTGIWESGKESSATLSDYTTSNGSVMAECRWRNYILYITSERAEIKLYVPESEQFNKIPLPTNLRFPMDICVFYDKPYLLCKNSDGDVCVYEITLADVSKKLTLISSNLGGSDNFSGRNAMFVDLYSKETPRMIAVNFIASTSGGNSGFEQWEIEYSGGSLINNGRLHTNNMGLHYPFDASHSVDGTNGGLSESNIIRVFNDTKFNVDESPRVYIEYRDDAGNGALYQSYVWEGPDTPWTNVGGIQQNFSLSYAHEKGADLGARVGNLHQADCYIRGVNYQNTESGNIQIEYVMESNYFIPNGTNVAVRFLYDVNGHAHREICSIENASSGTISDNKIIIPIDSGVVRTVEWNYLNDGFQIGDSVYIHAHISTSGVS